MSFDDCIQKKVSAKWGAMPRGAWSASGPTRWPGRRTASPTTRTPRRWRSRRFAADLAQMVNDCLDRRSCVGVSSSMPARRACS